MRPDDGYATCPADGSCGCCVDALTDPEQEDEDGQTPEKPRNDGDFWYT